MSSLAWRLRLCLPHLRPLLPLPMGPTPPVLLGRALSVTPVTSRQTYKLGERGSPTRNQMRPKDLDESSNKEENIDALKRAEGPEVGN